VSVQLYPKQFYRKNTSDLKEKPFPAYKTLGFEGLHSVGTTGNSVLFPRRSLPLWGKNSLGPITSALARLQLGQGHRSGARSHAQGAAKEPLCITSQVWADIVKDPNAEPRETLVTSVSRPGRPRGQVPCAPPATVLGRWPFKAPPPPPPSEVASGTCSPPSTCRATGMVSRGRGRGGTFRPARARPSPRRPRPSRAASRGARPPAARRGSRGLARLSAPLPPWPSAPLQPPEPPRAGGGGTQAADRGPPGRLGAPEPSARRATQRQPVRAAPRPRGPGSGAPPAASSGARGAPGPSAQMATQVEPLLPAGAPLLQAEEHGLARKKPAPDAQAESGPGDGGGEPDGGVRRPRPACARPGRDGAERESPRPPAAAEAPAGSDGEDGGRRDFVEAPPPKVNPWTKHAPPPAAVNGQPPPGGSARRGTGPRSDAGVSLGAGLPGPQRLVATACLGPSLADWAGRGRSCALCSLCVSAPRECVFREHVSWLRAGPGFELCNFALRGAG
jgi:hypothetical protein